MKQFIHSHKILMNKFLCFEQKPKLHLKLDFLFNEPKFNFNFLNTVLEAIYSLYVTFKYCFNFGTLFYPDLMAQSR